MKAVIATGVCLIELRSCVRFIFRANNEKDYISVEKQPKGGTCSTPVGHIRGKGKQVVKLTRNGKRGCFHSPGVAAHELLHAAGFSHEHQRIDRSGYIVVHYESIEPSSKLTEHIYN